MENVLIGSSTKLLISAAIELESIPPESNTPNGTSDNNRNLTASFNLSLNSSAALAGVPACGFPTSQQHALLPFPAFLPFLPFQTSPLFLSCEKSDDS